MTKLILIGTMTATALMANMPLCDKTKLKEHQLNDKIYRDCKQVNYDELISKDEEIAYRIPNENCTKKQKKEKLAAIKRLRKKGKYVEELSDNEICELISQVPNYETWTQEQIIKYKKAKKQAMK